MVAGSQLDKKNRGGKESRMANTGRVVSAADDANAIAKEAYVISLPAGIDGPHMQTTYQSGSQARSA